MKMESEVYNCDAFEFMRNYAGEPPQLIVTDPPYEMVRVGGGGSVNDIKKLKKSLQDLKKAKLHKGYDIESFSQLVATMQQGKVNAYFWCNKGQIPEYFNAYVDKLGCKFEILCWHKRNALPTYFNKYLSDTEYCLYFHHGGFTYPQCYEDAKTWFLQDINAKDKKEWKHPTIKPLNIVRTLIRNSSKAGDLVFDPFLGSGTTRVAAYFESRKFVGCELNEQFYAIQEQRYNAQCADMVAYKDVKVQQLKIF